MAVRGGVAGGVLGFIVYLVIWEWLLVDWGGRHPVLEGVVITTLVAGGAFVGSRLYPRIRSRRP